MLHFGSIWKSKIKQPGKTYGQVHGLKVGLLNTIKKNLWGAQFERNNSLGKYKAKNSYKPPYLGGASLSKQM